MALQVPSVAVLQATSLGFNSRLGTCDFFFISRYHESRRTSDGGKFEIFKEINQSKVFLAKPFFC